MVGSRGLTLILMVCPAIFLLLLINLYPVIYAGWQSLRNGNLATPGDFVGLSNYVLILTNVVFAPQFWHAALFTLIFTVTGVFGSWVVGLGVALLLERRIPAGGVFKLLLLLPWIVPVVVSAFAFNFLVATPQSPFPAIALHLGLGNVLFLANPTLAQITLCVFKIWISFPFMMMMMRAALAGVDHNVYEAAKVDGATGVKTFRRITLPMISRTVYISWILMMIFCVNDFPTVWLLTQGGPNNATNTLAVLAYETVFGGIPHVGPGVSVAFLATLVLIIVSVILYRQVRRATAV
ncbi:MAG: sugar ABC transporter permease [Candidatus Dormiibacterota bacterium]